MMIQNIISCLLDILLVMFDEELDDNSSDAEQLEEARSSSDESLGGFHVELYFL